uniref:Zinc knuckle CX2CX4HX4C domain-containing protein n=1 Tax=Nelumbo nucifera TaxID=4432 RepID=A0A822YGH2_NELNU|nr:TPA_asm: hypothetical protein HUJ06_009190 [Nelumbo nucifera]
MIPRGTVEDNRVCSLAQATGSIVLNQEKIPIGCLTRGLYVCKKIIIDLRKPLYTGHLIFYQGKPIWLRFFYEQLPRVCANCGLIGHIWSNCKRLNPSISDYRQLLEERTIENPREWLRAKFCLEKSFNIPVYNPSKAKPDSCKFHHSEYGSDKDSEDGSGGQKRRCIETSYDLLAVVSDNSSISMHAAPVEYPPTRNAPTQTCGLHAPSGSLHAKTHHAKWQGDSKLELTTHYFTKTRG